MRANSRIFLKRAGRGETEAFYQLTEGYFNLLSEYLYLCNLDRTETESKIEEIFREGWMRLPFMTRLADWEVFLARTLMAVEVDSNRSTEGRRPTALVAMDPRAKFALVAFDL